MILPKFFLGETAAKKLDLRCFIDNRFSLLIIKYLP